MNLFGEKMKTNIRRLMTPSIFRWRMIRTLLCLVLVFLLTGCAATPPLIQIPPPTPSQSLPIPTSTLAPTHTFTPIASLEPSPTPLIGSVISICSPLAEIALGDLHSITSQGFTPSTAFQDDGHPGVDLAFFTFADLPSMYGHPVQAILPGKVVLVIENRFPYGSMILVETPLEWVDDTVLPTGAIPTPIPQDNIDMFSPCANDPLYANIAPIEMSTDSRSLYVLYSHLQDKPAYTPGDMVSCGEIIGAVGLTGNTVAEHLHLEIRIGPSDAEFNTFAMYKPDATIEERYYYCNWSTSGRFQPIDPSLFWKME